jgi:hypothetical protein
MIYTFLLLVLFLLLLPFGFALDRKNFNLSMLKSVIIPSLIVTIIYSEVAVFFAMQKVWIFNKTMLVGTSYRALPLEGYLFIFALTFCSLSIYSYLNKKYTSDNLQKYSLAFSNLLLGVFVAVLYFAHTKWFAVITVSMLLVLLLAIEYVSSLRFMYRFYRAFVVSLIPFYISFGIICNLPIITYNVKETMAVQFAHIPFENHFYFMGMLLLGVYFVEYFKDRASKR